MKNSIDKIIKKMRRSPTNIMFEDLAKVLIFLGYELCNHTTGSHRIFRKAGCDHVNIPFARPVKKHYVKKVLEIYDEEMKKNGDIGGKI
jgi:hypothetical protein